MRFVPVVRWAVASGTPHTTVLGQFDDEKEGAGPAGVVNRTVLRLKPEFATVARNGHNGDRMAKMNFWQWLGVALLLIGVVWFIYNKSKGSGSTQRTMAELRMPGVHTAPHTRARRPPSRAHRPRPVLGVRGRGAKVLSWVVVSGLVFRKLGAFELGMLAAARATVGFLNYAGMGKAPLVHRMSAALAAPRAVEHAAVPEATGVSFHTSPRIDVSRLTDAAYSNGSLLACTSAIFGLFALAFYSHSFAEIHRVNSPAHTPAIGDGPTAGAGYALPPRKRCLRCGASGDGRIWVDYAILSVELSPGRARVLFPI